MLLRFLATRRLCATAFLLVATAAVHAMSVIAPPFGELVASATTVARGVVTDVHCVSVDTPQGTALRTLVTLHVERVLKGSAGSDLTLSFLGGKLGPRTLTVLGMPTFRVGDREIVFVGNNGPTICPLVAAGYGRFHVRHDPATNRDYVTRDNNAPLVSTDQVVQALGAPSTAALSAGLTLEAFESKVTDATGGVHLQP